MDERVTYECKVCNHLCTDKSIHEAHFRTKRHSRAKNLLWFDLTTLRKEEIAAKYGGDPERLAYVVASLRLTPNNCNVFD